ncbi:MAG: cytochrome ubiquinol oxidase subunit I [Planctomycetota bacterium]
MPLDSVLLSRIQFALTVGFHYLFPPLTIGLGLLMVFMEGAYLRTKNREYEAMAKFWTKIFGLIFAMGVATGIVMEFQFGTNWSAYSRFVGDVFGAALAAEGIFAFFLESGFLAVLVFGWERVSARMHFFATCMVALGSIFSAIWIVVANSWQQTPAGFTTEEFAGVWRAELTSFWGAVLNPSTVNRLTHTLIGAFIMGGFFVTSVSAYYLLKGRHEWFARKSIAFALPFAAVFSIVQLVSGHFNSQMVGEHQPTKLAAFEGHFKTEPGGTPLHLFGWVDEQAREVRYGVAVPGLLSFLTYSDWNRPVRALDDPNALPESVTPLERNEPIEKYWPPVNLSFQTYRLMVGLGMLFILLTVGGTLLLWHGRLFRMRWLLYVLVFAVIGPVLANQAGWAAAEVGRQPWIVWGLMRTSQAVSPAVTGGQVLGSIIMFGVIYLLLLVLWLFLMDHKIRTGPESPAELAEGPPADWLTTAAEFHDAKRRHSLTDVRPSGENREKE